jgi:hypothetical protein
VTIHGTVRAGGTTRFRFRDEVPLLETNRIELAQHDQVTQPRDTLPDLFKMRRQPPANGSIQTFPAYFRYYDTSKKQVGISALPGLGVAVTIDAASFPESEQSSFSAYKTGDAIEVIGAYQGVVNNRLNFAGRKMRKLDGAIPPK